MVCAIYKKGRSWSSLLSIPSKVLERCVFIDLYLFLKPWLNNAQYNFRRGRSSVIQMLVYLNQAYNSTARDDEFEVVYAIDKVDHGILLEKLWNVGVRGKLGRLIRSYMSNRVMTVRVSDSVSCCMCD